MKLLYAVCAVICLLFIGTTQAQNITFSTQSSDLNICGPADTFSIVLQNTTGNLLDSVEVVVNFHNGVVYQSGSLSGFGYGEKDITNLDSVTFAVKQIDPFDSDTIWFLASAGCDAADSSAVNNSITVTYVGGMDMVVSAPYNILVPALSVQSISPSSFTGPLGTGFSRCVSVINGGFGSLSDFFIVIERDPGSLAYSNFTLSANSSALSPVFSGDSIIIQLTPSQIQAVGDLDTLLELNEIVEICYDIQIIDCIDLTSTVSTYWGCNGAICERQATTANVIVPALVPNLVVTDLHFQNHCYGGSTPSLTKIIVTNNGTGAARDVVIDLWQGEPTGPSSGYISRLDTSNVILRDSSGNTQVMPVFGVEFQSNSGVYACLGPAPVRRLKVLIPLIQPGEQDTLIVEQYTCCKTWCSSSPTVMHRTHYQVDYNDQCFTSTYVIPANIVTSWNYGRVISFASNGPTDVAIGDTATYCIEHSNYRFYNDEAGAYMWTDLVVPPGLTALTGPGDIFYSDIDGDLWFPDSVFTFGDTIRSYFTIPQPPGFTLEKSNYKFKLITDCSAGPCSSGPKNIDFAIYQVADTACACVTTIACHNFTVNSHCGICPATCVDGGMIFTSFDSYRLNYGLPDNNNDGLPDTSGTIDPTLVRTKYCMLRDTLFTRFRGYVDTTAANPFWVDGFARSTITRGTSLTPDSYDVRIVDASTSTVYTCNLLAPTLSTSGTTRTFTYALDTASISGCVPPGFVYEVNDSIEVTAIYVVSANPGGIVQTQTITNEFVVQTPGGGLLAGCDNYSGSYVLVGYYYTSSGANEFSASGCNTVNVTENYYLSIGNCCSNYGGGNIFDFEFRHWGIIGTGRVVTPPGYSFVSANVRHYRTAGNQSTANNLVSPLVPAAINGDTIEFDLGATFTSGGGTIPLGDDGYHGILNVLLQPSCEVISDTMQAVRYLWDFEPIPALTGPGSTTPFRTRADSLFYEAPSLTINPVLPTAPGINSTISWDFTIENNSNTAASDSTWFALVSPSNLVVPISVIDLVSNTPIADVNGIYQIGLLLPDSVRSFRVVANYANCNIDSLQIVSGWDCNTYPANLAAYACTPATAWLYIDPQPSVLQANLTLEPGPHDICDSLLVELEVVSSQLASVRDIDVQFLLPLSGGLTFAPGSAEMLYPAAGSFVSIPDPTIAGNSFGWDVNTINAIIAANDLPGTVLPDSNSFVIRFYLYTDCNMISGDRLRLRLEGDRICGDPLSPVLLISDPININGAVQPYQTTISAQAVETSSCPISETISVQIINGGLGATSTGDSIFVNLSPGYSYANGFVGQVNPPTNINPTVQSGPGGVRLGWESVVGIAAGDTISFDFEVDVSDAVPCGPDIITVQTVTNQTLFCARTSSNCTAATQTGSTIINLNIQRADLSFTGFNSTIQPIGGGYDYIYNGTIQNAGTDILPGTTTNVDFYCDSDQSGGYTPGDVLLSTYTTTNGITTASPHSFSGNFFIPTASCSDTNMIYALIVPNSAAGYCICDTAFGNSNVVLPVEWLSLNGEALPAGNEITWEARLLPQHDYFLVERRDGTNWEIISPNITTRQSSFTWLDDTPGEVETYRIRSTDRNGQRSYSATVEIVRENALSRIQVYPNPAMNSVFLEARPGTTYRIFNALGQSLLEGVIDQAEAQEVSLEGLSAGVYLIGFRMGAERETVRLVVE